VWDGQYERAVGRSLAAADRWSEYTKDLAIIRGLDYKGRELKKRVSIKILLALLAMMVFCPTTAYAVIPLSRIQFLLHFFDLNEAAYADHRHCVSETEAINDRFMKTVDFITDELLIEVQKEDPRRNEEFLRSRILERRYDLQYKLDLAHMNEGCSSPSSKQAQVHYNDFSRYSSSDVRQIIKERTIQP